MREARREGHKDKRDNRYILVEARFRLSQRSPFLRFLRTIFTFSFCPRIGLCSRMDFAAWGLGRLLWCIRDSASSSRSSPSGRANAHRSPPFFRFKKPFESVRTRLDRRKWGSIAYIKSLQIDNQKVGIFPGISGDARIIQYGNNIKKGFRQSATFGYQVPLLLAGSLIFFNHM